MEFKKSHCFTENAAKTIKEMLQIKINISFYLQVLSGCITLANHQTIFY